MTDVRGQAAYRPVLKNWIAMDPSQAPHTYHTCAETRPENEDKAPGAVLGDATQLQQLCGSPPAAKIWASREII